MRGSVYKRCWCRVPGTKRPYKKGECPKARQRNHGKYWFRLDVPPSSNGRRRQPQYGPYDTQAEAEKEMATELARLGSGRPELDRKILVKDYLELWLDGKRDLKESTLKSYREAMDLYFVPGLGHLRLVDLRKRHVEELIKAMMKINRSLPEGERPSELLRRLIDARADDTRRVLPEGEQRRKKSTKPLSPARLKRIKAVLDSALNSAVKGWGLREDNPAKDVQIPRVRKPKPLVWTPARIARWEETGKPPSPVMVWTPQQIGEFLDSITQERLYALFHLTAFRGLRRAEVIGLPWSEVDLDQGVIMIRETITDDEYEDPDDPKSDAGERAITLDAETVSVLTAWRIQQNKERLQLGEAWPASGRVFTRPDGRPLRPPWASVRFETLHQRAKLPPIRFHDLRHGSAALLIAAGYDLRVVKETLGHTRSTFTADTYGAVLPQLAKASAEGAAAIVPRRKVVGE